MCCDFLYNFCPKHFSFQEELNDIWYNMYIGLHVKYPLFLLDLYKTQFFRNIFAKYSIIKFHENPFSDSRVIPCGLSDWERDVTKLTVAFRNSANAPKNLSSLVIGNNIATGFSDYLTLIIKQRQSSLHKEVLLTHSLP